MTLTPITEDIEKFFSYINPNSFSYITETGEIVIKDISIENISKLNQNHNIYAPYRKIEGHRITQNVSFLKNFVIDIDNDKDQTKSKAFEDLMHLHQVHIDAKVFSGGGYHYYIAYCPLIVDNSNREKLIKVSNNFCQFLLENNIDVDRKTFDLPRLIRVWGTYNHSKQQYCRLIWLHEATKEQQDFNFNFLNNLKAPKIEVPTTDSFICSCSLINYLINNPLNKPGERNDTLMKNIAAFLRGTLGGQEGLNLGISIAEKHEQSPASFKGWYDKIDIKFNCGEMINYLRKFYPELQAITCNKCRIENKNKILYTDGTETFNQLKNLAREKHKLIINKELSIRGTIKPYITDYKETITMMQVFEVSDAEQGLSILIKFFDEPMQIKPNYKLIEEVSVDFYIYNLLEGDTQYLLLSEKVCDLGESIVEGSLANLKDNVLVGNYSKTLSKKKILIANKALSLTKKINSLEELFNSFKINRQEFLNFLYHHKYNEKIYLEPEILSDLLLAFLFSSKQGYPLHLLLCGPQGCGKSSILEAISEKFDEPDIGSGSTSTIKGLVPSFGGKLPQLGRLLSSYRFCFIDEFFGNISENDIDKLRTMNEILEHKQRSYTSGKGCINNALMKGKLFGVTNPIEGTSFEETMKKIPETAAARILVINLNDLLHNWIFIKGKQHKKFVNSNSIEIKLDKYLWYGIYDFLNSFISEFDEDKVLQICNDLEQKVPQYMRAIYKTRYSNHHSLLLLDGIIKTRCLFGKDSSFNVKDEDYFKFRELWEFIIGGWSDQKLEELTNEQKLILELIGEKGINTELLKYDLSNRKIDYDYNINYLLDKNKILLSDNFLTLNKEEELNFENI